MHAIEVLNLEKRFGNTKALDGLTFSVGKGEIYALLGKNGAGKSTTLKILAGLLRPDNGCARILGRDVRDRKSVLERVGYIPEGPVLFPYLTAREVLMFSARMRGMDEWEDRVRYLLEVFELDRDKVVATMSKGMVQKLAACVALIHEPEVLIMDEPMSNMDPHSQHVFKELVRESGATALISTHQLAEVERFCDRVGIIYRGKLVEERKIDEVDELEKLFLEVLG
ncbi:MAG: ABC transporter ATP-binding protein [Archaeoglobi archaeon]|nr:ABC transporter ATP-binding protein [Archaeoglobi archaeon]